MKFLNNVKAKSALVLGILGAGTSAFADVTYDTATGAFTGSLDLTHFYTMAGIATVAIGSILAVKIGLSMLRSAK